MDNNFAASSGCRIPLDVCMWIQANWDEAKAINESITTQVEAEVLSESAKAAQVMRTEVKAATIPNPAWSSAMRGGDWEC